MNAAPLDPPFRPRDERRSRGRLSGLATYAFTDPAYKWGDPVFGRPSGTITFGFDASFYSELLGWFGFSNR